MAAYDYLSSRAVIGMFYQEYGSREGTSWAPKLSNKFVSNQSSEIYPFIGANSRMSEVEGGSKVAGHNQFKIVIANKHYDNVLHIHQTDMMRDKTDQILNRVGELSDDADSFDEYQISSLLLGAEASVGYDGQYFFDTDHLSGSSGSQSNIVTVDISTLPALVHGASAAAPSPEEIQQAVNLGITRIMSYKNDKGQQENRNVKEFTVMVPFSLWAVMFNGESLRNGTGVSVQSTDALGRFKVNYELNFDLSTWTTQFVVFRSDARTKAFITQEETAMNFKLEGEPKSSNGYNWEFAVDTYRGYGYGRWERSALVKLT